MNKYALYTVLFAALLAGAAFADARTEKDGNPSFSQQELDQMLAPIALYPDALLSQVLMAATYPLEVVQAARWTRENPSLRGEPAVRAAADKDWDPSVQSLVAFPQILQTMDRKIEWTERLGDAFLAQQPEVTATVQALRRKARDAGTLAAEPNVAVREEGGDIEIEASRPDIVYVPYYDPAVVYGSWWWADYPPVFWSPWPDYAWHGPFAWGIGIGVGVDFFFGGWDWPHRHAWVHDRRHWFHPRTPGEHPERAPWHHDRDHRRNVPYRNDTLDRQFPRSVPLRPYEPYRGRAAPAPQPSGMPVVRPLSERPATAPARPALPPARMIPAPPSIPERIVVPQTMLRPNAFEGIGQGRNVRDFSARGHTSQPVRPPVPNPSPERKH